MAPPSWTWSATRLSTCCPTERRTASRGGFGTTLGSRWSPATGPRSTARVPAGEHRGHPCRRPVASAQEPVHRSPRRGRPLPCGPAAGRVKRGPPSTKRRDPGVFKAHRHRGPASSPARRPGCQVRRACPAPGRGRQHQRGGQGARHGPQDGAVLVVGGFTALVGKAAGRHDAGPRGRVPRPALGRGLPAPGGAQAGVGGAWLPRRAGHRGVLDQDCGSPAARLPPWPRHRR